MNACGVCAHGVFIITSVGLTDGRSVGRSVGRTDCRTVGRMLGRSDGRSGGRTVGRTNHTKMMGVRKSYKTNYEHPS